MVPPIRYQLPRLRRRTGTRGSRRREGLPVHQLDVHDAIFRLFENFFLHDLLEEYLPAVLERILQGVFNKGRVWLREILPHQLALALLLHDPPGVLRGEASRLDVSFQAMAAPRPGQLPLDVLVEVVLLLPAHDPVEHDEEDAQGGDEQARADELVEEAARPPGHHVVGQQAGSDEEEAQGQEADADVQHADGGAQPVLGQRRDRGLLGVVVHAVDAVGPGGEAALPLRLPLGPEFALPADGPRRVESGQPVHLQSQGSVSVFCHSHSCTAQHLLHTARHCTQCGGNVYFKGGTRSRGYVWRRCQRDLKPRCC